MADPTAVDVSQILEVLADLSPPSEPQNSGLAVPTAWFRWLPMGAARLFGPWVQTGEGGPASPPSPWLSANAPEVRYVTIDRDLGERLAAIDQVRAERLLRVGWLFVVGPMVRPDGRSSHMFHPLVTVPVRVGRRTSFGGPHLIPAGDAAITDLVTDPGVRHELESKIAFGGGALTTDVVEIPEPLLARLDRLRRFARSVAEAADLPAGKLIPANEGPEALLRREKTAIVAGFGVFALREAGVSSRASSLRSWSTASHERWSALHSLYLGAPGPSTKEASAGADVESPYLLTPRQRQAVISSRSEAVTLISGAPGTGKSHTIAAIACDAVAHGESVLVAAKTDATVDALLDLLERSPGPDPVVFGSNERRDELARRLAAGQLRPVGYYELDAARRRFEAAERTRADLYLHVREALAAEAVLDGVPTREAELRRTAPGLFGPTVDLDGVDHALSELSEPTKGWLARRHQRERREQLYTQAQAPPGTTVDKLRAAAVAAHAVRQAGDLAARGGLEIGDRWRQLEAADDFARRAMGEWVAAESRSESRLSPAALGAVAALATALRSGRAARRTQLRRLDDGKLTTALPLWVGTLADVDDLLPPVAGLFDLVVLDEASSIDQPLAATSLLRGRRAVVAGDPQQLRQVSFVSDAQLASAVSDHGLEQFPVLAARLDVRRNSAFDLAAGATTVNVLGEHFRSDPHLVEFVAQRLYGGAMQIATRSPSTQSRGCVEIVRVAGQRDGDGVVAAEVQRVVEELHRARRAGRRSVGVVTPFRAQADAIEGAVLDAFSADELEFLNLRVGTAHAFQGNERDLVIVSLGVGPDANAATWRFVEDPHLFAVLMTRARRNAVILVSADPPDGGLVAGFLAQAGTPPGPPKATDRVSPWAHSIADDLRAADFVAYEGYPTGRHVLDLCCGWNLRDIDIECQVHPDGPDAHIDRHLELSRRGWQFVDAYPSRWRDRRAELVVEVIGFLHSGSWQAGDEPIVPEPR